MNRTGPALAAAVSVLTVPACAAAIKAPTVGCATPATAQKIALVQQRDRKGADALSRPLVASRECIDFARGVKIEVEERRPPMACVRLPGDLSCFWIAAALSTRTRTISRRRRAAVTAADAVAAEDQEAA